MTEEPNKDQDNIDTAKLPVQDSQPAGRDWFASFVIVGGIAAVLVVIGLIVFSLVCVCGKC